MALDNHEDYEELAHTPFGDIAQLHTELISDNEKEGQVQVWLGLEEEHTNLETDEEKLLTYISDIETILTTCTARYTEKITATKKTRNNIPKEEKQRKDTINKYIGALQKKKRPLSKLLIYIKRNVGKQYNIPLLQKYITAIIDAESIDTNIWGIQENYKTTLREAYDLFATCIGKYDTLHDGYTATSEKIVNEKDSHNDLLAKQERAIQTTEHDITSTKKNLTSKLLSPEHQVTREWIGIEKHPLLDTPECITDVLITYQEILGKKRKNQVNDPLTKQGIRSATAGFNACIEILTKIKHIDPDIKELIDNLKNYEMTFGEQKEEMQEEEIIFEKRTALTTQVQTLQKEVLHQRSFSYTNISKIRTRIQTTKNELVEHLDRNKLSYTVAILFILCWRLYILNKKYELTPESVGMVDDVEFIRKPLAKHDNFPLAIGQREGSQDLWIGIPPQRHDMESDKQRLDMMCYAFLTETELGKVYETKMRSYTGLKELSPHELAGILSLFRQQAFTTAAWIYEDGLDQGNGLYGSLWFPNLEGEFLATFVTFLLGLVSGKGIEIKLPTIPTDEHDGHVSSLSQRYTLGNIAPADLGEYPWVDDEQHIGRPNFITHGVSLDSASNAPLERHEAFHGSEYDDIKKEIQEDFAKNGYLTQPRTKGFNRIMARKTWGEHIHNLTIANNQKTSEALLQRTQTEQGKLSYDWCKENLRIQKEKKGPEILSDMEIQHILYKAGTTICRIFDKELNKIPMKNIEEGVLPSGSYHILLLPQVLEVLEYENLIAGCTITRVEEK